MSFLWLVSHSEVEDKLPLRTIGMHAIMLTDADWAIYGPKRLHSLPSEWIEQAELCSFEKEAIGGKKKQVIDLSLSQIRIVLWVSEAMEKKHTVCFSGPGRTHTHSGPLSVLLKEEEEKQHHRLQFSWGPAGDQREQSGKGAASFSGQWVPCDMQSKA